MRKLTLTLIGKDSEIASAKENIEDLLGHMPFELVKNDLEMIQIDFEHREEYVVHVVDNATPCGKSLEKALKLANAKIKNGVNPKIVVISLSVTTYIDDVFEGVNEVKQTVINMANVIA